MSEKLALIEDECHWLLTNPHAGTKPKALHHNIARDAQVKPYRDLPPKMGLQSPTGQARLLHDLANIELQAMEMGLRTLYEFPNTPTEFREQLVSIVLDEARHLRLCLNGIEQLGHHWGFVPVHTNLWDSLTPTDALLDRILIVHCYLEASGLDSGELILKKLSGLVSPQPRSIVKVIAQEEIDHVRFGLEWFRRFCSEQQLDPTREFQSRLDALKNQVPKRSARISTEPRLAAGFNLTEIEFLRNY